MSAVIVALVGATALAGCGALRSPVVLEATRPDTTLAVGMPLMRFERASAVGVAPSGAVYVADAGRDVIVRRWPPGEGERAAGREEVLGGPGGAAGQFDGPADVDPTNGLVVVVADAGNGRVQRFSRSFRHLETLPVGRGYAAAGEQPARPVYDYQADESNDLSGGRPVAAVEPEGEATYALDAAEGHVLKWEDQRRAVRVIGGFSSGEGALADPTDLAVGPGGTFYVADAGRDAVVAYDRFGSYLGERALGLVSGARALAAGAEGRMYLALPRTVLAFGAEGQLLRRVHLRLPGAEEAVFDVAVHGAHLYVLTATALYRVPRP